MYDNEFETKENKIETKDKIEPQHMYVFTNQKLQLYNQEIVSERVHLNSQASGTTTKAFTRLPIENYKTVNPKSGGGHLIKRDGYLQGALPTELWQTGKKFGILDTGPVLSPKCLYSPFALLPKCTLFAPQNFA